MKPLVAMTISFLLGATLATYFPLKQANQVKETTQVLPKVYTPTAPRK